MLQHEKLDVYQCSIRFMDFAAWLIDQFPKGHSTLSDQLRRAAYAIPLNIAEGVGKVSKPDKRRFFGIARGSAMECAAILDVCLCFKLLDTEEIGSGKELLHRIVSMLSKMCLR